MKFLLRGRILLVLLPVLVLVVQGRRYEWEDEDTIIVEATREEDRANILDRSDFEEFYKKRPGSENNGFLSRSRQGRAHPHHKLTCYSLLGDQGTCTTFRECFPMLYYTEGEHEGHIKHPVLADLLMSTSGPCLAAPFSFRSGRDDFVPYESSEEQQNFQSSVFADAKDLICCPSDKPSPIPVVSSIKVPRPSSTTTTTTTEKPVSNKRKPGSSSSDAVAALINTVVNINHVMGLGIQSNPFPPREPSSSSTVQPVKPPVHVPSPAPVVGFQIPEATIEVVSSEEEDGLSGLHIAAAAGTGETVEDNDSENAVPLKGVQESPAVDVSVPIDYGPGLIGIVVDSAPEKKQAPTRRPIPEGPPAPDVSADMFYPKPVMILPPKPTTTSSTTTTATTTTSTTQAPLVEFEEIKEASPEVVTEFVEATTVTEAPSTTTTTPTTTQTQSTTTQPPPATATTEQISTTTELVTSSTTRRPPPKLPEYSRSPCGRLNSTSDPAHPWVVAIKLGPRFICAGSLIDEYHVITAAHCLMGLSTIDIGRIRVYLGERILNSNADGPTIIRKVSRAMRHRGFSISSLRNDIALLKLSLPIPVGTKRVRPVCLPLDSDKNLMLETSSEATIVGWAQNWNEIPNDRTHENKYTVSTNDGCLEKYRNFMPHVHIEENMLCASLEMHPKGLGYISDIGSDGSPVIIKDKHGIYQQIGISSWRTGPSPMYPRVLTRVASFRSWLHKNRVRPEYY